MRSTCTILLALAGATGLALAGCEEKPTSDTAPQGQGGPTTPTTPTDEHEGEQHDLGAATIGGVEVRAVLYGEVTPGAETSVDVRLSGGATPAAIRLWIGAQDAAGAVKARAEADGDHYHAHIETPDQIPEGAMLWVEIESAEGQTTTGSFPLGG